LLDLPESVLSRYVTGDMLPSVETAQEILARLEGAYLIASETRAITNPL